MIVASACLLGAGCRYDGGSCPDQCLLELFSQAKVIPVCPEQMGGLSTPRTPCEIRGGDGYEVLDGRVIVVDRNGRDRSAEFLKGAEEVARICRLCKADTVVLKEGSPSCGVQRIADGSFSGRTRSGAGVTAARLMRDGFRVMNDKAFCRGNPR